MIYDLKVAEVDLMDENNYEIMKHYVPKMFRGQELPQPCLPTCKEHRVGTSTFVASSWKLLDCIE